MKQKHPKLISLFMFKYHYYISNTFYGESLYSETNYTGKMLLRTRQS